MKKAGIGRGWGFFKKGDDTYIFQNKAPYFSIYHTYFSEDAGLVLGYIRFAIPKKYKQERPI